MKLSKRHFYNGVDYKLDEVNKNVVLMNDFHNKLLNKKLWNKFGFKKIGGSSVGDVLETDDFKSQFAAFARMSWIGLPILDRKYVDAGIDIEPKVVEVIEKQLKLKVETFDPAEYNFDYFADKDDVIGGLPDGFIRDKKIIIEIKTTGEKNYDNWNKYGVPISYLKQSQLYSYLMGVEDFWIVATFLREEDYADPKNFPIKERKIKNYKYKINKAQIIDDISLIKSWYMKYTKSGISPHYNPIKDADLIEYLKCKNETEYKELLDKWNLEGKLKLDYE
ncbi:MAG: YqaJ viral recombinase family protein [Mycoplasmataceae bacterium]|nr:YqaJ viral recombinase family protein [Mycoplasmataceae bacterium]